MRSMNGRALLGACMSLLLTSGATPRAQHTVLVGTVGADTVAVDRFIRDDTSLEGVAFSRRPEPHTMHYKAMLAPTGRFTSLEMVWRDAKGAELRRANLSFGIDSIRGRTTLVNTLSVAAPSRLDAIPLPPQPCAAHAYALLEHAAIVLLLANKPGTDLEWITLGATEAEKRRVLRVMADTVELDYIAGPVRVHVGAGKRMQWMSLGDAATRTIVQRSATDIDIAKLIASFAARGTLPLQEPDSHRK